MTHPSLSPDELVRKRAWVRRQLDWVYSEGAVYCDCGLRLPMLHAYKCLYCGEWYCQSCAEGHFGQTRVDYNRKENVDAHRP